MAAFKLNKFSGLFPRIPESLLPESAATVAQNCDFAYGELRNTKGASTFLTMENQPRSIWTDDGLNFFTWTTDVDAVRSPLVSDTFNRLYYTTGTAFNVTNRLTADTNGGPPGSSYQVGVQRPTVAPTLVVEMPTVDSTNHVLTPKFHYEYGGIKYQETTIVSSIFTPNGWTFTAPVKNKELSFTSFDNFPEVGEDAVIYKALDTDKIYRWDLLGFQYVTALTGATPVAAVPVLRVTAVSQADQSQTYDIYSENSTFISSGGLFALSMTTTDGGKTFTATVTTAIKEADKEARAYVYTYVNTYNEEGPPSPPTIVNTAPGVKTTVTCDRAADGVYAPIKEIRIYRTPSGSAVADYFYLGAITVLTSPPGNYSFVDTVKAAELNEPLSSTYYYAPPQDLVGLMQLPNGILCAWKGNELWFSEAFKPWAWPPSYVKPLLQRIVGGIPHGSGAIITTVGNPFLLSGVSPDSMTVSRLNIDQAGASKRSIAVANGSVMYASNDGIVVINGVSGSLAQSFRFFTRDNWRERCGASSGLSTMRFAVWDGRLVVYSSTNVFTAFMIRFDEADGTMTDLPSFSAACSITSQLSDQLLIANGFAVERFQGGSDLTATWQSREIVVPRPMSFGIMQTVCTGSWTLSLFAAMNPAPPVASRGTTSNGGWTIVVDATGVTISTALTAGVQTLRMPAVGRSDRWRVRLVGTGRFRELRLANSGQELASV